ncbi:uncharacterized protein LOC131223791 [Magnolia sinica]|uniref:uncharacterized protein LOC131223791 n=1 Tax=Magnolia sinica TaxID=86752 RepID=UPI00265A617F|nr:uncharacterized protein LOC131223791 [Magnolia sinica]XP_058075285.1 uncharacterized protein LOC131223791 [Magnolia sinica]XP_058075286.1 uncharacterized protein LOC131223791 [Magnolia sinica]
MTLGALTSLCTLLPMAQRYGGGMSSAKATLESDTKVLAFEAGRRHKIQVNTISAGMTVIFILLFSKTWYLLEYLPVVTFFTLMKTLKSNEKPCSQGHWIHRHDD